MTTDVASTLAERGTRYGSFDAHAEITQRLKYCAKAHCVAHQTQLTNDQAEALDMIFHKVGRIVNGDPNYADSWHDIAGYAQLVADRLNAETTKKESNVHL